MFVILNFAFVGACIGGLAGLSPGVAAAVCSVISVKTQFSHHFKVKDTSQLIKGMSTLLQKLLKSFNGTIILRLFLVFVLPCSVP